MQNLPLPHIPSNPVFFSRQLWYYAFGIHDFETNAATMYSYHEGQARKGTNEVTSMLLHYLNNIDLPCRNLILFSDGYRGQNKNYVMLHFLYMLMHIGTYIFAIRGHSYLPNDQDFSLIEKKKRLIGRAAVPGNWDKIFTNARENPSPFNLAKVDTDYVYDIRSATEKSILKHAKPAVKIKDVRMIKIEKGTKAYRCLTWTMENKHYSK